MCSIIAFYLIDKNNYVKKIINIEDKMKMIFGHKF